MPSPKEVIRNRANVEERDGTEMVVLEHPYGDNCPYCSAPHPEEDTVQTEDGEEVVIGRRSKQVETIELDRLADQYSNVASQALDAPGLQQEMESRGKGHERFIQQ